MVKIDERLLTYLDGLLPKTKGRLGEIQRLAYDEGLPIISADTACFLSAILTIKRPLRILEIGCAVGFSAALFSQFLQDGGKIITIDRYEYMQQRAKENFAKLGISEKITLIEEDAALTLPKIVESEEKFDFIFMDCAKGQYMRFFPYCLELLAAGGLFVADDVLQSGVISWDFEEIPKRQRTTYRNLREFLDYAMGLNGYYSSILPIGDGLLICAKGDEFVEKS